MNSYNGSEILLYQTEDGQTKIDVKLAGETVWLTLNQMAELFQRDKSVVSRHIKNIFDEGELNEKSTVALFATVQTEGNRSIERNVAYYNVKDVQSEIGIGSFEELQLLLQHIQDLNNHTHQWILKGWTSKEVFEKYEKPALLPLPENPFVFSDPAVKEIGRNDSCPCGSGKKYKKCCLEKQH